VDESQQNVVRWFLDADDNPDSHQNPIITFWPIYNFPWNLHANSFRGFCIKSTNQQAKSIRKQLISFAQEIMFFQHINLKEGVNPILTWVRPWSRRTCFDRPHVCSLHVSGLDTDESHYNQSRRWSRSEVITEPECWSRLRKEFTIFSEAGAGPGVGFLNENRTRSWSRSDNFSFCRSRIINFMKFKFSLNG